MPCPLCNDTGDQRYWEGRWRDEKAETERLRLALTSLMEFAWYATGNHTFTATVPGVTLDRAREALKE